MGREPTEMELRVAVTFEKELVAALGRGEEGFDATLSATRAAIRAMGLRDGKMDNAMLEAACNEIEEWTDPTDPGAFMAAFQCAIDAASPPVE